MGDPLHTGAAPAGHGQAQLRHEALLYYGLDGFLGAAVPFVQDAVIAGQPVMVAVPDPGLSALRTRLGSLAESVQFVDMVQLGTNPARIIPAWREFADAHQGRELRGIGEPVWATRSPSELVECQHHETLVNRALADVGVWLLCPYDAATLPAPVLDEAYRSHPLVADRGGRGASPMYEDRWGVLDTPLAEPVSDPDQLSFEGRDLGAVRRFVADRAHLHGLADERVEPLVLAIHEVASNSVRHGGGHGTLSLWPDDGALICEVRDEGRVTDPLAGRRFPPTDWIGGRGLWIANQVCDLVQVRSGEAGTTVRVHMRLV